MSSVEYQQTKSSNVCKRSIHHDQVGYTPGMQGWCNIWEKPYNNLNRCGKTILQSIIPFIIKTHDKLAIQGNLFKLMKNIYEKPTATIILNGERLIAYSLWSEKEKEKKDGCSCHFNSALYWKF